MIRARHHRRSRCSRRRSTFYRLLAPELLEHRRLLCINKGGEISGDEEWLDTTQPYCLVSDVTVLPTVQLTVGDGVTVRDAQKAKRITSEGHVSIGKADLLTSVDVKANGKLDLLGARVDKGRIRYLEGNTQGGKISGAEFRKGATLEFHSQGVEITDTTFFAEKPVLTSPGLVKVLLPASESNVFRQAATIEITGDLGATERNVAWPGDYPNVEVYQTVGVLKIDGSLTVETGASVDIEPPGGFRACVWCVGQGGSLVFQSDTSLNGSGRIVAESYGRVDLNGTRVDLAADFSFARGSITFRPLSRGEIRDSHFTDQATLFNRSDNVVITQTRFDSPAPVYSGPSQVPVLYDGDNVFTAVKGATIWVGGQLTKNADWSEYPNISKYLVPGETITVPPTASLDVSGIEIETQQRGGQGIEWDIRGTVTAENVTFSGEPRIEVQAGGQLDIKESQYGGGRIHFKAESSGILCNNRFTAGKVSNFSSKVIIDGNRFAGTEPVETSPSFVPELYDNIFEVPATINVHGEAAANATWYAIPNIRLYAVHRWQHFDVARGSSLVLQEGVNLDIFGTYDIDIQGSLISNGSLITGQSPNYIVGPGGALRLHNSAQVIGGRVTIQGAADIDSSDIDAVLRIQDGSVATLRYSTFRRDVEIHKDAATIIRQNDFSSTPRILLQGSGGIVDLSHNYWGSQNPADVIVDCNDQASLPCAVFSPTLSDPPEKPDDSDDRRSPTIYQTHLLEPWTVDGPGPDITLSLSGVERGKSVVVWAGMHTGDLQPIGESRNVTGADPWVVTVDVAHAPRDLPGARFIAIAAEKPMRILSAFGRFPKEKLLHDYERYPAEPKEPRDDSPPSEFDDVARLYLWDSGFDLSQPLTDRQLRDKLLSAQAQEIVFVTHGWNQDVSQQFLSLLAHNLTNVGANPPVVFGVDWNGDDTNRGLGSNPNGKSIEFDAGLFAELFHDSRQSARNGIQVGKALAARLRKAGIQASHLERTRLIGHSNGAGLLAAMATELATRSPGGKTRELVALDAPFITAALPAVANAGSSVQQLINYYLPAVQSEPDRIFDPRASIFDLLELNVGFGRPIVFHENVVNVELDGKVADTFFPGRIAHTQVALRYATSYYDYVLPDKWLLREAADQDLRPLEAFLVPAYLQQFAELSRDALELIVDRDVPLFDLLESSLKNVLGGLNTTLLVPTGDGDVLVHGRAQSPVLASLDLTIPPDVVTFGFDVGVFNPGAPAPQILVTVADDETGSEVIGVVDLGVAARSANNRFEFPISEWERKEVSLQLVVRQASRGTEFLLSNMTFTIDDNDPPTDLSLSPSAVHENDPGAVVGTFLVADPDLGDRHSFELVGDYPRFQIDGRTLRLKPGVTLDHESEPTIDVRVKATDSEGESITRDLRITVIDVNERPSGFPDTYSTDEDVPLVVEAPGVLGNDTDPDDDPLTAELGDGPEEAERFDFHEDGSFSYTPRADFHGTDRFTYRAFDGDLLSEPTTVTIEVQPLNDPPVGRPDRYMVDEDNALDVAAPGVLDNDSDFDGDPLRAVLGDSPENSKEFDLHDDGSFSYTPEADFHGTDRFTYRAFDGDLLSEPTTVTIEVQPLNDPPMGRDDRYMVDEDNVLDVPAPGVLDNDSDVDGDPLRAVLGDGPENSKEFDLHDDGSFSYTPEADFHGTDHFTYRASDGDLLSEPTTVTIDVKPVNDRPEAQPDRYLIDEDNVLDMAAPGVLGNDSDVDGDPLTAELIDGPGHNAENGFVFHDDGSFSYTPEADFHGTDHFTYRASDGDLLSEETTVTIEVTPVNDRPEAQPDRYLVDEDNILDVAAPGVLGNDSDIEGDPLTAELGDGPKEAEKFVLNDDGSFSYTPKADFHGIDRFTYRASDGDLLSEETTVTIEVTPVNDRPEAQPDRYLVDEDDVLDVAAPGVLGNDSDVDGDPLTAVLGDGPEMAEGFVLRDDGSFSYTPKADFHGIDQFTYRVFDGELLSDETTVTIEVKPVNDPPIIVPPQVPSSPLQACDAWSIEQLAIVDVDALEDPVRLQVEVDAGSLILDTSGLSQDQVTGNGTGTLVIVAPVSRINQTLAKPNGLVYRSKSNFDGTEDFRVHVDDQGHTGEGGNQTADAEWQLSVFDPQPWTYSCNPLNVNGHGGVTPVDALILINFLNANGPTILPVPPNELSPPPYFDVSGDQPPLVAPQDVLIIFNHLNNAGGEAEARPDILALGSLLGPSHVGSARLGADLDDGRTVDPQEGPFTLDTFERSLDPLPVGGEPAHRAFDRYFEEDEEGAAFDLLEALEALVDETTVRDRIDA